MYQKQKRHILMLFVSAFTVPSSPATNHRLISKLHLILVYGTRITEGAKESKLNNYNIFFKVFTFWGYIDGEPRMETKPIRKLATHF